MLAACLHRGNEWLQLGLNQAVRSAVTPRDALERLLTSYLDLNLDHPEYFGVLLMESTHLPDEQRDVLRRIQHDYVTEWVALMVADRPALTETEARVIVHGALSVVHERARAWWLQPEPGLRDGLLRAAAAVLLSTASARPPRRGPGG